MKNLFAVLLFMVVSVAGFGQKPPSKFGAISIEEMTMTRYEPDTTASAVVLFDYGNTYMNITNLSEKLTTERHVRIKILKKEGLDLANVNVPLYYSGSDEQSITNLKATTYNLEQGKIVESKMGKESVFRKTVSRHRKETSFALPNVKEGSVIEYSFQLQSDFLFVFPDWQFQLATPVKHSEYWVYIPDFCNIQRNMQGYLTLTSYEVKSRPGTDFSESGHHWVMKDVPAFKEEPFMTTERDYVSMIRFNFASYQFPGGILHDFTSTWEKIAKDLIEDEQFGLTIKRNPFLKDIVASITTGITEPQKKIEVIYDYVKTNVAWDGTEDVFADNLKKVLENHKGTAADINLLLASMLNKAEIPVEMAVLSTRDHGFIRQNFPAPDQLNYVICVVKLGDNNIFLDATEKYLPMEVIPERCLNGAALLVSDTRGGWIDVTTKAKSKTTSSLEFAVATNGDVSGKVQYSLDGYDAYAMRKSYFKNGEKEYLKSQLAANWQVEKSEFANLEELKLPAKQTHVITIPEHASASGDVIYVSPFPDNEKEENPFKLEKREYPVDYGSKQEETIIVKITIPEGFQVEEVPASKILALPQNAGRFMYNSTVVGNTISITSSFQINKALFLQDEYPSLREFYNQFLAKKAEQIVLKKK